jgi:hypothetical protein
MRKLLVLAALVLIPAAVWAAVGPVPYYAKPSGTKVQDGVGMDAALFEDRADDAFLLFGQSEEQVDREHHLAFVSFGNGLGLLESLLGFLSEFVDAKHRVP